MRKAALSEGLLAEIERWRMIAVDTSDDAWVFPSERMTPLSKDNCYFLMRRTRAALMKALGADGKLAADQLGHLNGEAGFCKSLKRWSGRPGSNQRRPAWELHTD
jgi:hypothetical protein